MLLCLISLRIAFFYSSAFGEPFNISVNLILIRRVWRFLVFVKPILFRAALQKRSANLQRRDILFRLTTIGRTEVHFLKGDFSPHKKKKKTKIYGEGICNPTKKRYLVQIDEHRSFRSPCSQKKILILTIKTKYMMKESATPQKKIFSSD